MKENKKSEKQLRTESMAFVMKTMERDPRYESKQLKFPQNRAEIILQVVSTGSTPATGRQVKGIVGGANLASGMIPRSGWNRRRRRDLRVGAS